MSQDLINKFCPKKGVEGNQPFQAPGRKSLFKDEETPGPQSYKTEVKDVPKKSGNHHPFSFNEKRFLGEENDVPGAGTYNFPDTVKVKHKNK